MADSGLSPRVLLVDDHEIYRAGLRGLLEEAGIDIVGEAARSSHTAEVWVMVTSLSTPSPAIITAQVSSPWKSRSVP